MHSLNLSQKHRCWISSSISVISVIYLMCDVQHFRRFKGNHHYGWYKNIFKVAVISDAFETYFCQRHFAVYLKTTIPFLKSCTNRNMFKIFCLIRFCTSNLDDGKRKKDKSMLERPETVSKCKLCGQYISNYQTPESISHAQNCWIVRKKEKKNIMSFRQIFPWANIISTVESEGEQTLRASSLPLPPSKTHADMKIKTRRSSLSHNAACPSTHSSGAIKELRLAKRKIPSLFTHLQAAVFV